MQIEMFSMEPMWQFENLDLVTRVVWYGWVIPYLKALDKIISNMPVLRFAIPLNVVEQGTYKTWPSKEAVGAANNWTISVSVLTKTMSSLLCDYLMTQRANKFTYKTESYDIVLLLL